MTRFIRGGPLARGHRVPPDENDHHQREDEGDLELDAENEARHVFESAETEPGGDHARDIADTRHHHDHEGAHRVGEPQIGMDRPCHDGEAARRAAKRRVEPIGHGKDAIRVDAENARGARVLRRGADRLSEPCLAQKEPERPTRPDREPESEELDTRQRHHAVEQMNRAEIGIDRADIRAEERVRKLLDQDRQAEGGEDGNEDVAVDDAKDDGTVDQPADAEHHRRRQRQPEKRRQAPLHGDEGDVTAEHDEFALHDIDDVEYAPDQRHAIGGEREDRADQKPVQDDVERERRVLDEKRQVIEHETPFRAD